MISKIKKFKEFRKGNTKAKFYKKHKNYTEYLKSEEWIKVKAIFLSDRKTPKCAYCKTTKNLQVHHLSYNRLGTAGEIKDLMVFCRKHHHQIHQIEEAEKISIRQATKRLLKTKLKKQRTKRKKKPKQKESRLDILQRQNKKKREQEQVFLILGELRDKGIKTECKDLNILKKLKSKYITS
jgi:hypothetical protein